jgi:hypothetical protein
LCSILLIAACIWLVRTRPWLTPDTPSEGTGDEESTPSVSPGGYD